MLDENTQEDCASKLSQSDTQDKLSIQRARETYMQYPQTKYSDLQNYPSVKYFKPFVKREYNPTAKINEPFVQYPQTKFSDLQDYPSVQYSKQNVKHTDLPAFVG